MFTLSRSVVRALPPLTVCRRVFVADAPHFQTRLFNRRAIHSVGYSVPSLTHIGQFSENGVPDVFSQKAFNTAWTEYQRGLVDKLNELTAGTVFAHKQPSEIAVMTSRQADLAATFNYASQAHNNHFFFETLAPHGNEVPMPEEFLRLISYTFSSREALKTELLETAASMFGSGWVWLVADQETHLRILCTYNAGTPYGAAHRRQDTDMNTGQALGMSAPGLTKPTRRAAQGAVQNWATPLLNIPVWEHAWLEDFGVWGKRDYLQACWRAIDWNVVASRIPGPSGNNGVAVQRILYNA